MKRDILSISIIIFFISGLISWIQIILACLNIIDYTSKLILIAPIMGFIFFIISCLLVGYKEKEVNKK